MNGFSEVAGAVSLERVAEFGAELAGFELSHVAAVGSGGVNGLLFGQDGEIHAATQLGED